MTNNIAKIRAALEIADRKTDVFDAAKAALAELERAAKEPVAWRFRVAYGTPWQFSDRRIINGDEPLYTAPPAPVVEIREAVITDEVARKVFNAWIDARWRLNEGQDTKYGHAMINVVRAELGPALGLVEIREPTPEECERIHAFWLSAVGCIGRTPGERMGGLMFNAVRAVMWPKSEGL